MITDLPEKIPGLDACATCVAVKAVHSPHKEERSRGGNSTQRANEGEIGWWRVLYIVMDDYTHGVQVTTMAQVGSARSLRGIQGHSRERMPEKDARNHDGQSTQTVYGRDEGYLRAGKH